MHISSRSSRAFFLVEANKKKDESNVAVTHVTHSE